MACFVQQGLRHGEFGGSELHGSHRAIRRSGGRSFMRIRLLPPWGLEGSLAESQQVHVCHLCLNCVYLTYADILRKST